jgi:hypothetical protein
VNIIADLRFLIADWELIWRLRISDHLNSLHGAKKQHRLPPIRSPLSWVAQVLGRKNSSVSQKFKSKECLIRLFKNYANLEISLALNVSDTQRDSSLPQTLTIAIVGE